MSNVSLARIMYGVSQEIPAASVFPVSNRPSTITSASASVALPNPSLHVTVESLLHRAFQVFSKRS